VTGSANRTAQAKNTRYIEASDNISMLKLIIPPASHLLSGNIVRIVRVGHPKRKLVTFA
jgi:hypothetical protein